MPRTTLALSLGLLLAFAAFGCGEQKTTPPAATGPTGATGAVSIPPKTGTVATSQPSASTQPGSQAAAPIKSSPNKSAPGYQPPPPDVAAPPADAQKTPSGLASKVLKKGTGKVKPKPTDTVKVHYTGWTTDGNMFDSSVARNTPATFPLNRVIPGWTEGVGLMVVGEKRRLWIPQDLAYKGRPGAPAGMLVFEVELLDIVAPPEAPKDVKAAPKDAQKTSTGLASKVLKKGTGTAHPTPADRVTVHYTGWTTDGKMFDSSVVRGQPATFPLGRVIPGWTEGVQLMVEGEKRRFWIPEELAYKGRPGPQGMLVFDVELIKILGPGAPQMGGHGPGDGHGH
ncbi:MAG TPA: FKBP-type peptidyl-prolyl cis-trans isomerase [Polyangia bacterium]|jgi:peptidylprolyl isomerase